MNKFEIITAIVTPFYEDLSINFEEYTKILLKLLEDEVDGVVVAGTTGEGATLFFEEKKALLEKTIEVVKDRIKIYFNVGTNHTLETIKHIKEVDHLEFTGYLVVCPYYNNPTQEGIYQHYKSISQSTSKEIMLYNVPSRTNSNIEFETIVRLASISNIKSIKEACGNLTKIEDLIKNTKLKVYTGNDLEIYHIALLKGSGVVSVVANLYAKEIREIIQTNDFKRYNKFKKMTKLFFMKTNPIVTKAIMEMAGYQTKILRLPLISLTDYEKKMYEEKLNQIKLSN